MLMTSRPHPYALAVALSAALSGHGAGYTVPVPSPEEVIARHVASRGGIDAWKRIASIRRTYEFGGMTIVGLWSGDRARLDQFTDDRTEVSAIDAKSGWTQRSWEGPAARSIAGAEAQEVRERAALGFELFLVRELGLKVAVAGEETYGRAPVIKLAVETPSGEHLSLLLDAKTYLEVARLRVVNGPDGPEEIVTRMLDYRPEAGILMAHEIGPGYASYKINEAVDPSWFQRPK